jgi:D-3-phosphoglycerate dehydrogenase
MNENTSCEAMVILVAEALDYSPEAMRVYQQVGQVMTGQGERSWLMERMEQADVLVVRLGFQVDREILARGVRLKAVVSPTTGLDHIDMEEAASRGIAVLSLKGETDFLRSIPATAELAWGLVLALIRRIPAACADVVSGHWRRDAFRGQDLRGRTLGIVGLGRVGSMVAQYGIAFGMRVMAYEPDATVRMAGVANVALGELLAESDVVSVHVPLQADTVGLLSASSLGAMKPGALLINTSRGGIVDESALLNALEVGHLGGAALDVLEAERSKDNAWVESHPLVHYARTHDNLLITPHIGGASRDSMAATELFMAHKLRKYIEQSRGGF